jgi:NADPH-dependent glutamate synthase beta subunit-like oxidoreductase
LFPQDPAIAAALFTTPGLFAAELTRKTLTRAAAVEENPFYPPKLPLDTDNDPRIRVNRWGEMIVDQNQMTNLPEVFPGGDLVRGASLVVHAVRGARRAAEAIHEHISPERARKRTA